MNTPHVPVGRLHAAALTALGLVAASVGFAAIPNAPTNIATALATTAIPTQTIRISWTDNATDETGFAIERQLSGQTTWREVGRTGVNATQYLDTTNTAATAYLYRVRAFQDTGVKNSFDYSAYATVTVARTTGAWALANTANTPAGLSAALLTGVGTTQTIRLTWTDNSFDEDGFLVERRIGSSGAWVELGAVLPGVTTFTDHTNTASTAFQYRVRGFNYDNLNNRALIFTAYSNTTGSVTTGSKSHLLAAFPGAVGYGAATTHGRPVPGKTARVVKVTSLLDYDDRISSVTGLPLEATIPGTLRWALTDPSNLTDAATGLPTTRMIVFDVGGIILLKTALVVTQGDFYLAGQSAPAPGITTTGASVQFTALPPGVTATVNNLVPVQNALVRHLRFRRGDYHLNTALGETDSVSCYGLFNSVVDHCEFMWGGDGSFDIKFFQNLTVMNSLVGPGNNEAIHPDVDDWWHNKLSLIGGTIGANTGNTFGLSLYRNVWAYDDDRGPVLGGAGTGDVVNSLMLGYNLGLNFPNQATTDKNWLVNLVGNTFDNFIDKIQQGGSVYPVDPNALDRAIHIEVNYAATTRTFLDGNFHPTYAAAASAAQQPELLYTSGVDPIIPGSQADLAKQSLRGKFLFPAAATPPFPYTITSHSAARTSVLADVGATIPRRDFVANHVITRLTAREFLRSYNPQGTANPSPWAPFYDQTVNTRRLQRSTDSQLEYTGNGWLTRYGTTTRPSNFDTDNDGMADAWETANGFSVGTNDALTLITTGANTGYTRIEAYLNNITGATAEPVPSNLVLPSPASGIFDGGFENGAAGWVAQTVPGTPNKGPGRYDNTVSRTGTGSFYVFNRDADNNDIDKPNNRTFVQQRIISDLTRLGQGTYFGEAWVKLKRPPTRLAPDGFLYDNLATSATARVLVRYLDNTGTLVVDEAVLGTATINFADLTVGATSAWVKVSGSDTVGWTTLVKNSSTNPFGAYFAVEVDDVSTNDKAFPFEFYVDDCYFARTPPVSVIDYEAEVSSPVVTTGQGFTIINDATASGDQFVRANLGASGKWVEFTINVATAGTYTLSARYQLDANCSIWQCSVNGVNLGATVDSYAATPSFEVASIGSVTLAAGPNTVRFRAAGKNTASTSFRTNIDRIRLQ